MSSPNNTLRSLALLIPLAVTSLAAPPTPAFAGDKVKASATVSADVSSAVNLIMAKLELISLKQKIIGSEREFIGIMVKLIDQEQTDIEVQVQTRELKMRTVELQNKIKKLRKEAKVLRVEIRKLRRTT